MTPATKLHFHIIYKTYLLPKKTDSEVDSENENVNPW